MKRPITFDCVIDTGYEAMHKRVCQGQPGCDVDMDMDDRHTAPMKVEDQMTLYGIQPQAECDCESDVGEHFRAHAEWWRAYNQQVERGAIIPGY
eukprot:746391-Hanusia_phi.AAC.4